MKQTQQRTGLLVALTIIVFCSIYLAFSPQIFKIKWSDLNTINDNTPTFAALAIMDGKVLVKDVRGCAEFKHHQCVRVANINTKFPILSVTKHFTAAILLMLEEDGLLSIDDEVIKYLPDFAEKIPGVKIKHLIFHISGINYSDDVQSMIDNASDVAAIAPHGKIITEKSFLDNFHKVSNIKPYSTEYMYSNIGYCLLTAIIEKVTGTTYEDYIQKHIFDRHGMYGAFMATAIDEHQNYTLPYKNWPLYKDTQWMKYIRPSGSGGIFLSIDDYIRWINAFDKKRIFKHSATMDKFLSIGRYDNDQDVIAPMTKDGGPAGKYGFGMKHLTVQSLSGQHNIIIHRGNLPGSAAYFIKIPEKNAWIVYFNNNEAYPDIGSLIDILLFQRVS